MGTVLKTNAFCPPPGTEVVSLVSTMLLLRILSYSPFVIFLFKPEWQQSQWWSCFPCWAWVGCSDSWECSQSRSTSCTSSSYWRQPRYVSPTIALQIGEWEKMRNNDRKSTAKIKMRCPFKLTTILVFQGLLFLIFQCVGSGEVSFFFHCLVHDIGEYGIMGRKREPLCSQ